MENILLVILLLVALAMIGLVLVQRNEGGGLGIGGGGGGIGGRPKANPLARLTWVMGIAFFGISIALTILNNDGSGNRSVLDGLATTNGTGQEGDGLLPPPTNDDTLLPPAGEGSDTLLPPTPE